MFLPLLLVVASVPLSCEPVDVDKSPRILTAARELAPKAGVDRPMDQCTLPAGVLSVPTLVTRFLEDGSFQFIVSREFEELFSEEAVRGVVGHELGHLAASDHNETFWRPLTAQQKLGREADADTAAVRLVGRDAVLAALSEYRSISEQMAAGYILQLQKELGFRTVNVEQPVSRELTDAAREIIQKAGLPYTVTVRIPEVWRQQGVVNAMTTVAGNNLLIRVSPLLIDDMDAEGLRGLLAHELAHPQGNCGPKYKTVEEGIACEHKADVQSAKWVGRTAALRGLCQMMASTWEHRYKTDVSDTIERIRLLHESPD